MVQLLIVVVVQQFFAHRCDVVFSDAGLAVVVVLALELSEMECTALEAADAFVVE